MMTPLWYLVDYKERHRREGRDVFDDDVPGVFELSLDIMASFPEMCDDMAWARLCIELDEGFAAEQYR